MIKVSVFYPAEGGSKFNHEYYRNTHIPMAVNGWKPVRTQIDKGIDGPYVAGVHFTFDSMEAFQACMTLPVSADLAADLPNYSEVPPIIQVSEIFEA